MLGFVAFLLALATVVAPIVFRFEVLTTTPFVTWIVLAAAIVLGIAQWRRRSRWPAKVLASLAIVFGLVALVLPPIVTHYGVDRAQGPAVGINLASLDLTDAVTGARVDLARGDGPTLVVCLRGFW